MTFSPPFCHCWKIWVAVALFGGIIHAADVPNTVAPAVTAQQAAASPALFKRVVLLGASVTAGFDISQPFGGPKAAEYRFSKFVEAALTGTHEPVISQGNALFSLDPKHALETQVTATVAAKPSLVIGIDALFWLCYGGGLTSEQRLSKFEFGLKQFERIKGPLVLGDIPDASMAVGGILDKEEMPDPAVLEQCNARLKKWAKRRKNVALFPLTSLMALASSNEEVVLPYGKWEKGTSRALLRSDSLHPSHRGLAALAVGVLDAAKARSSQRVPEASILHDLEAVYVAAMAADVAVKTPAAPEPAKIPK